MKSGPVNQELENAMSISLQQFIPLWGLSGAREKFEDMCLQLIKSEHPQAEAIRVVQGDGGIDAHIGPLGDPSGIHVFQVKFFKDGIGESQKTQIRESFRRARESTEFRTKTWTLCTSLNMGIGEKKWFESWAAEQEDSWIAIQPVWDEARIVGLLLQEKNKGIRESFFRQEHLDILRESNGYLRHIAQCIQKPVPIALQAKITRVSVASVDRQGDEAAVITVRLNFSVTNTGSKAAKEWDVEFAPVAPDPEAQDRYITLPDQHSATTILPSRTITKISTFGFKLFRYRFPLLEQLADVLYKTEVCYRPISEEGIGEYETVRISDVIEDMGAFRETIIRSVNNRLSW